MAFCGWRNVPWLAASALPSLCSPPRAASLPSSSVLATPASRSWSPLCSHPSAWLALSHPWAPSSGGTSSGKPSWPRQLPFKVGQLYECWSPGVLPSMWSHRVRCDLAAEQRPQALWMPLKPLHHGCKAFSFIHLCHVWSVRQKQRLILRCIPISASGLYRCSIILAEGFPGGSVVKSLPANAGHMGSIPDRGRSHVP